MRTNNSEKGALRVKEASEDNAAQTQGRIAGLRQVERATREGRCSKGIQPEIGLRKAVRERESKGEGVAGEAGEVGGFGPKTRGM